MGIEAACTLTQLSNNILAIAGKFRWILQQSSPLPSGSATATATHAVTPGITATATHAATATATHAVTPGITAAATHAATAAATHAVTPGITSTATHAATATATYAATPAATHAATHAATPDITATATHATTTTTASVSYAPGQHTAQGTDAARPAQRLAMAPPSARQPSVDLTKQPHTPYRRVYRDPAVVTAAVQRLSQGERWHDIAALGGSHTSRMLQAFLLVAVGLV